jgi:NitT/TauT family transport system substrate-binding protein
MQKRFIAIVILFALLTLLLAACAAPAAAPQAGEEQAAPAEAAPAEEAADSAESAETTESTEAMDDPTVPLDPPAQVKVAYVPIMKFAAMYVAEERGLFDKYGLDVDIERVKSGTEAIAFLSEGTIDVGGIAIVTSLWNGWNQGLDIRIIAPGALEPFENSPTKLVVRKELIDDGTVTDVADLAGMTVALAGGPGSGGEYLLSKALERGDLTIRDVETVQIGNADMPAAFENGSIDAGLLGSPYADQVIDGGFGEAIATDLTPGLMTVAFVGSGDFVTERPEAAQRFVLALMEATRMMQGDDYLSDENIAAYLKYVNSTEDAIRNGRPVVYDPNMVIPIEGLADVERVHRENGRTEYDEPIDLEQVVDTTFTDEAREILGEVSE